VVTRGLYVVMDDFDQFVAGNVEQLLRTAYVITWDAGEAEDLVQECLFKIARRWHACGRWRSNELTHGESSSTWRWTIPETVAGDAARWWGHPRLRR
jgi:DNA-directed RNA polymerase specialized sigma24 family protein